MRRWLKEFFISSEERMKIENEFPNIPKMLTITLKNINNKLFTDNIIPVLFLPSNTRNSLQFFDSRRRNLRN